MKVALVAWLALCMTLPLTAQIQRQKRKSLLNSDPEVIYLEQTLQKPIVLQVIKDAPVFSDKQGTHKIGILKGGQSVNLEAITDKVYKVRGQGARNGVAGWVAPWAFSSEIPDLPENLKALYHRQIHVQALIAAKTIAIGMRLDEVSMARGKPTKTSLRKTQTGQTGRWEYIDYEEVKNYATEVDRTTGAVYRRLVSVTRIEKSKTSVEFENDLVTAIEESEDRQGNAVQTIVPPLIFRW
jgi:hypothetical protein